MPPDTKELRILILEDVATDAELMVNALRDEGLAFQWQRVDTHPAFIAALEAFHPDIVLVDYKLPAFTGRDELSIVRQTHPEIPVIITTGAIGDEAAIELVHLGAKDYVLKGNLVRLGPAVRRAIAMEQGIRARKSAEQVVRKSELRYRRLFEAAQDGILLLNASTGQIEDVNPFLIDMLGYSHAEFLGKKLWEIGATIDETLSKKMFAELQEKSHVRYENMPLKTRDGRLISVEFVSNTYLCGETEVIQCNIRDVTLRKRAEAKLLEQLDELQRFEQVSVGREQRMHEIKQENARLAARLAELEQPSPNRP